MKQIVRIVYQNLKSLAGSSVMSNSKIQTQLKYFILLARERHYEKLSESEKLEELKKWYYRQTGEELNLNNPQNFNQKIQWLKIYDNTPIKTELSDKYLVREWVKKKIGERYLIPIYGAWDNADDIDFDSLPEKFILKANHGSGMNYVVKNKSTVDKAKLKKMVKRWLKTPYDMSSMEQQYYAIPRKVIAEKYIDQNDGNLMDYKIHCFNGVPKIIQVIGDRDLIKHTAKECYFDLNWKRNDNMYNTYEQYEIAPDKPECFDEMIEVAKCLSKDFIYVRVDLYVLSDGIKFGEMTFTPAAGIGKWGGEHSNQLVGKMIDIIK